jgi:ABC-type lipoprotein export system ATPase subunit
MLELIGISLRYRPPNGGVGVTVFEDLSLELGVGEFVVIAGRSGSGKTSLLQVAAGLLPPTSGDVRWTGQSVVSSSEGERARLRVGLLGFVFQGGGLIGSLTAAENVALPSAAIPGRIEPGRVRAALEAVELEERARHFPAQLSGGEQQRVGLARALVSDPAALIVDEPTASLDRGSADRIIDLLDGLNQSGRALLVATHDLRLIERAARVVHLD